MHTDSTDTAPSAKRLDNCILSNYCNYNKTKIIRIGNSRCLRLPKKLSDLYGLQERSDIEIEEYRNGILLRPAQQEYTLSWEEAYRQMAAEQEESLEWGEWEASNRDGLDD